MLKTAALGASGPLMTDGSLIAGGTTNLRLKGEASVAQVEVAGDDDLIEEQTVNANRLRLALEGSHEQMLASGSSLTPSLELGLRHDGGDGLTGGGIEIGGGLRYRDPATGLTELKTRGWSFVGPTTVYAFMQAAGIVNDHLRGCAAREGCAAARRTFKVPQA